jgi:hypothetical protein
MPNQNTNKTRQGDTGRTSNQGRKFATGGNPGKRGDPQLDENSKASAAETKKPRKRRS